MSTLSRIGLKVPQQGLFGGEARKFYYEVCRCVPFIQKAMKLDEIVSVRDIRSVVKEKFKEYKDVKDQRVIDLLIFKGRQELETYLTLHKNRHHAITEYLDPIIRRNKGHTLPAPQHSAFMESFLGGNSAAPTGK
ncbi:NADH:ubiquinone oxidoreductase B14 subunit [Monoraphidium neglectum]|uniref:NADH:ubiquinone oxidoreductase B14 subunit n=1 Tax=Monoraphidium neglectum TaxID=145388 RepID=A0A0D2MDJ3_9CHLO|nr:NADH:ubiquinone oxidoreductase B14 subunit [Monoraphidium neglectum]KIY98821.1 NADH:ubiquinone oxidoreductase B14 subunit [Monoraphidium neglectum]|eukprot:XP_013897841.1 NADH:ubiquinone oxidoreductase B14 subunit [Monoraphidium neglectum]